MCARDFVTIPTEIGHHQQEINMARNIDNITRHSEVSEKAIEKYLGEQVKLIGGLCLKYTSSNLTGFPDRLVCLPGGHIAWVELKSKGKKPTRLQDIRHTQLRQLGFAVSVADCKEDIDLLINDWRARI